MNEHTPGPFRVSHAMAHVGFPLSIMAGGSRELPGRRIALVANTTHGIRPTNEALANAELLAAAPDLLALAERILDELIEGKITEETAFELGRVIRKAKG